MKRPKWREKHGPEYKIQKEVIEFLENREWYVERLIGNVFQSGIPDLYVYHKKYGSRWIDIKTPKKYEFTKDQIVKWPAWEEAGIGVWIIVAATELEYDKLFQPPNMRVYWKEKYNSEVVELTKRAKKWAKDNGPEYGIQQNVIEFLESRHWHVERLIGNLFQFGIPDLYAYHKEYGERWIDVKNPVQYEFTRSQKWKWPIWEEAGIGVWILIAATEEEYTLLFKQPNMRDYWKNKYNIDIDALLDELGE